MLGPAIKPVIKALATRPGLWPAAVAAALSLVPRSWWRRPPFLPLPDRRWLRFRLVTAYGGDGTTPPTPDDIITWLTWRRQLT